jgi:uncharacterized membrane protein YbjE (DUF340 family)
LCWKTHRKSVQSSKNGSDKLRLNYCAMLHGDETLFNPMTLLSLTVPLAAGIILGYLLRNRKRVKLEKASLAVIVILIFSLGFSIGSNNELLSALPNVGLNALIISLIAILFSIAFMKAGRKMVKT